MTRRNPPAKWVLPETVNPESVLCVTIKVPNERFYKAAFWGALLDLASAYKWADDPDHTAKQVALVWRDIIDTLELDSCPIEPAILHGMEIDFDMGIRVDCDCNVWVTCCDGTEIQLATVGMIGQPGQPGGGQPQPQPGGGTAKYSGCCDASGIWLLPVPLSTGDVVTVSNVKGAWTGNGGTTWNCPDGEYYFAGACVGGGAVSGSDPLPSANHMRLIMFLDGDFYDLMAGAVTIPAGVDTVQGFLQANDDDLTNNSGQVCFDVNVTNNQATPAWSHYFDFKTAPLWASYARPEHGGDCVGGAVWTPGQGWGDVPCVPMTANYLDTEIVFAATDLTAISVAYSNNNAFDSSSDIDLYIVDGGGETLIASIVAPGAGIGTIAATGPFPGVTRIRFRASIDGLDNHTTQLSAIVSGPNSNPFV